MARIKIDREAVAKFCRDRHILKLALFGSVLRDDFGLESDVDLLVEFEPGKVPGLIRLAGMEFDLSPFFGGRKIDLRTSEDLSRYFRVQVVATAEAIYAA